MPFMEVTTLRGDALNQHAKKVFKGLMRAYAVIISMATLFYGALFLFDFALSVIFGEELPFPGEIFIIVGLGLLALGAFLVIYIFFINKTIFSKIQEGQLQTLQTQNMQNPYERYQSNIPLPSRSIGESIIDKLDLPTVPALIILFIITLIASSVMVLFGGLITIAALPIIFMCITSPCLMWVSYAYSKDIYEPEPARSILLALGWGMMSCIPSLVMNTTVSAATGGNMFLTAAIGAPLIEEFWKPIGLYFVRKDIDDELDGVIYGMSCGMGFAMLENFHYASRSLIVSFYNPGTLSGYGMLVVLRSVTSIVGHMVGPACIGYGYAIYLQRFSKSANPQPNSQANTQASSLQPAQNIGFLTQFAILRIPLGYGTGVLFHFIWNGTLTAMSASGTTVNLCGACFGMILFMFGFPVVEFILLRYLMHLGMKKNIEKYSEKAKDKLPPS
ncbi:MAG: PrsW family intramembrane metalloprotease, partial [Thermoplasmata archaeon]